MSEEFDPYRQWLGRTAPERPLNYYQLLGLREFEEDRGRIENAEMIEMAKVLRHEAGPQAEIARRVCEELQQAVSTLSDAGKKAAYDAQLRAQSQGSSPLNYYQLLNLRDFEEDRQRIETAEMIEMSKVLRLPAGPEADRAREALERALSTLLDAGKKAAYDAQLRVQGQSPSPPTVAASPSEPPPAAAPPAPAPPPAPVAPAPARHDFSADLKLDDEEEEEPFVPARPSAAPVAPLPSRVPAPTVAPAPSIPSSPAIAPSPTVARSPSILPSAPAWGALETGDVGLAPKPSAAPTRRVAEDAVTAAIDKQIQRAVASIGQPDEPGPSATAAALQNLSMPKIPIKPLLATAGAIGLLWVAYSLLTRGEPTGQLYGKITHQGEPLVGAEMRLESTSNPDNLFIGISSTDGTYQVSYRTFDGVPVGQYKVTITRYVLKGGQALPEGEDGEAVKYDEQQTVMESIEFQQEIAKGSNTIDFELTKGQKVVAPTS